MEELQALQAQFMKLQKSAAAHKLSDRVCVEILMKLLQKQLIEVYYTIDGKEYVTPEQLGQEIEDELLGSGGRVLLTDLQPILNVDFSHIEKHAVSLCRKDKSVQLINGELVCEWYLDRVAEEVQESLADAGHLQVSSLASRFGLSSDVLRDVIERRLAGSEEEDEAAVREGKTKKKAIVYGRLEGSLLYTQAFIRQHTALLRGLFSALTVPTPVATLSKAHDFHEGLFYTLLVDLINEGRIAGSVQGRHDNAQFIPAIFSHQRTQYIVEFFSQNGYIEYNTLAKFQINDPKKYLRQHYSSGLALESCFVSATEVIKVDSAVAEALEQGEWIDVAPLVPSPLSMRDIKELLKECTCLQPGGTSFVQLCDNYVVSGTFLNTLLAKYRGYFNEWAANNNKKILASSSNQLRASSDAAPVVEQEAEDDDDDDWSTGGKGKKGKKGKRGKGKGKTKGKAKGKVKTAARPADDSEAFDADNLRILLQWHPELPEDLAEAIVVEMHSKLMALREEASRVVFLGSDAKKKFTGTEWQTELHTLHWNIELFHKCAKNHQDESGFMEKHLLKSLCADVVNLLLEANASHYFIELSGSVLKASDRSGVLKKLKDKPLHEALAALDASLTESVDVFLDKLWDVTENMDIRLRNLDKRSERELLESHKFSLREQLQQERNPSHAYHLAVLVVYAKAHHVVLHVPGKSISDIFTRLKGTLPGQIYDTMHDFGHRTKAYLTAKVKKQPEERELLAELEDGLPEFKAAVETELDRVDEKKEE